MRAPAIGAGNRVYFAAHRLGTERAADIEIVVVQIADDPAHLASAETAVVVNDDRGFARRARHGPRLRSLQTLLMNIEMEPQVAQIVKRRGVARYRRKMREQRPRVVPMERSQLAMEVRDHLARENLQGRVGGGAADDFKVVAVDGGVIA